MFVIDGALLQALVFVLALVIVNVVLGILIALRDGVFDVRRLPGFLKTEILPYYLGLLALAGLAMVEDLQGFGTGPLAWAVIILYATRTVFGEIKDKVVVLFGFSEDELEEKVGGTS
ncbi:hypothetical protein [Thermodesulfitimonas autotrophica]|uniref:hypothetical protein n=1 Tax=Thermodesulfitimonas autotrophica TaxID=1894989 RepID=UPI002FE323B9